MAMLVMRSHESPTASWELVYGRPAPALSRVLREPYYGYVERTPQPLRRREYPGVRIVMIIELGPPIALIDPGDESRSSRHARGFVAGLHASYALTEHRGYSAGIQVNLTPTGARELLGVPMHELTDRVVALEDLLSVEERELLARLCDAASWEERFCFLDRLLLRRLLRAAPSDVGVHAALRAIERAPAEIDVAALARTLGCSHKHLIARFRDQVGITPKLAARIARFEAAVALLRSGRPLTLSELASRAGYYDQAHLARDFRAFTGGSASSARAAIAATGLPPEFALPSD